MRILAFLTLITVQQPADSLPLPTPRKISFTSSEGSWMSVDVSPDGKTIVFDLLGDLYTLPIGSGAAKSRPAMPPRKPPDLLDVFISPAPRVFWLLLGAMSVGRKPVDGCGRIAGAWLQYDGRKVGLVG
jgi:hypothetical protein